MDDKEWYENHRLAYQQLCTSYHAIDDFRAKLLALLPLATGTGVLLLFNNMTAQRMAELKTEFSVAGAFGFLVTLGLFSYELYGIKKCHELIKGGREIEDVLNVSGHFEKRPRSLAGFVNEPFAAGIIYPAVLAAWAYVGLFSLDRKSAAIASVCVFIAGFAGSIAYNIYLEGTLTPKRSTGDRDVTSSSAKTGSEVPASGLLK